MMRKNIKPFCCIPLVVIIFCILSIQAYAHNTISAGGNHTVGIKTDGTVVAVGASKYGQCDVYDWTNIVEVAAGAWHTVGLKTDGTVVAVGDNGCGQCNVSDWKDIVSVAAGGTFSKGHTVGLKSNGTVVAVGNNDDGQCNVSGWNNIIAIAAGQGHTIGLKKDGTVISTGNNDNGQCNVSRWKNIIAISANDNTSIGLNSTGAMVGNVSHNKSVDAIAAGSGHAIWIKPDGTVDDSGWKGQWFSVKDKYLFRKWQNIVAIAAGGHTIVGLKEDGTVVANGANYYGQCEVEDWHDIRIDNTMKTPDSFSTYSHSNNSSVFADDNLSNPFSGWTDDQIVFMLGQLKAEINKRGLTCPKDTFASITNNDYDDYDLSEWSDDDLLLSLEQVKEIITEKELLISQKVIPTPKPRSNSSISESNAGNNTASSKNSGSSSSSSIGSTSFYGKDRSRDAWVCAIKYVEDNLKVPSTAKFCKYTDATVMRVGEDEYIVHGYVDAQNSFGTIIRQNWTVSLTLTDKGFKNPYIEFG